MPPSTACALAGGPRFEARRTFARIVTSDEGGPKRLIISGRRRSPTGTFVALKAGARAMPWESMRCELPMLELCEVASPVYGLMAQPHRLEMAVRGVSGPLVYYPDLELEAASDFVDDVCSGTPFATAARRWRPSGRKAVPARLVVEVKDDADKRNDDSEYQDKLRLARETYARVGRRFVVVTRSRDLQCADRVSITSLALDRFAQVGALDAQLALRCVAARGAAACFADVVGALGGGSLGRAKASALHVRRVLSIDLGGPLLPFSKVRIVDDGRSLLRKRRRG